MSQGQGNQGQGGQAQDGLIHPSNPGNPEPPGSPGNPGIPVNAPGQAGRIEPYRSPSQAMVRGALPEVISTLKLYHTQLLDAGISPELADQLVLQLSQTSWEAVLGSGSASGRPAGRGGPRAQGFR